MSQSSRQPLVRIDQADKILLEQLSAKTGESTPKLLHRAVKQLKKQIFFEQMNNAYSALRADEQSWQSELEERALLEQASGDGLI
jgi:hypothetical protein